MGVLESVKSAIYGNFWIICFYALRHLVLNSKVSCNVLDICPMILISISFMAISTVNIYYIWMQWTKILCIYIIGKTWIIYAIYTYFAYFWKTFLKDSFSIMKYSCTCHSSQCSSTYLLIGRKPRVFRYRELT